ncbi:hypothetical protein KFK09_028369 [Dendrobium nobile]|uniref:Bidirectional sugar transporter SWEET n=1 Tax=Dendrobium nobile TaxID=94219 RepID=A0A8T3A1S2_DENNO|nr:hypothetical protein KFK09_028369 [Dendrobium nobile]
MVSTDAVRNVVGIIGNVISFGLFLSPLPTFIKIWRKKAVEQFSPIPYVATLLNCMLWVFYGLPIVHPNSILVVTINGTGIVLEGAYLTIFFLYAPKDLRLKVLKFLAGELAFMAVVVSVVLTVGHTHEKRTMMVGILCVIFGTCMYASPLTVMADLVTPCSYRTGLERCSDSSSWCCMDVIAEVPRPLSNRMRRRRKGRRLKWPEVKTNGFKLPKEKEIQE